MSVPECGSLSLGIVVAFLVRYFIRRFKAFGPKTLGAVISVMLGGAAIKFLESDKTVWWFYPIGLLAGFVLYAILGWFNWKATHKKKGKGGGKNGGKHDDGPFDTIMLKYD